MQWNYLELAVHLVKAIRGQRSRSFINRKLGYSFDQCKRWESGTKKILWHDFIALLKVQELYETYCQSMRHYLGDQSAELGESQLLQQMGTYYPQGLSPEGLLFSKHQLYRWQQGHNRLPLAPMLQLMELRRPGMLLVFLQPLVPLERLPCIDSHRLNLIRTQQQALSDPLAMTILRALDLQPYKEAGCHHRGTLASLIGCSQEDEDRCINLLRDAHLIEKQQGLLQANEKAYYYSASPQQIRAMKSHWLTNTAHKLRHTPITSSCQTRTALTLFTCSDDCAKQIHQTIADALQRIAELAQNDDAPPQRLQVVGFFQDNLLSQVPEASTE